MTEQTHDDVGVFAECPTETSPDIRSAIPGELERGQLPPLLPSMPHRPPWLLSHIGRLILSATASTFPMVYYDAHEEVLRSGAVSSYVWTIPRKRGKRISLAEACRIAVQIMEEAEQRLHKERVDEAQFVMDLWVDTDEI